MKSITAYPSWSHSSFEANPKMESPPPSHDVRGFDLSWIHNYCRNSITFMFFWSRQFTYSVVCNPMMRYWRKHLMFRRPFELFRYVDPHPPVSSRSSTDDLLFFPRSDEKNIQQNPIFGDPIDYHYLHTFSTPHFYHSNLTITPLHSVTFVGAFAFTA
jgi:hypothetical protein